MHEYSGQIHKLFNTKIPYLNTTTRRRLLGVTRWAINKEHKNRKKFPPEYQFSTVSSSTRFHTAIILHSYSTCDETYGNLILWEGEQWALGISHSLSTDWNGLTTSCHSLPFSKRTYLFGSQRVILIKGSRGGCLSSGGPWNQPSANRLALGGRGEKREFPSSSNAFWHSKGKIVTPFTASLWDANLFWHTEK